MRLFIHVILFLCIYCTPSLSHPTSLKAPATLQDGLSPLWAQELVGADLIDHSLLVLSHAAPLFVMH